MTTLFNFSGDENEHIFEIVGFTKISNFILPSEEQKLLELVYLGDWQEELSRRVQHFGSRYDYFRVGKKLDQSDASRIPSWLCDVSDRIFQTGLLENYPNQIIINEYMPGQGIAAHVDRVDEFGKTICSLSLGSDCLMQFKNINTGQTVDVFLPRLSLIILNDDARYLWTHKIAPRKSDKVNGQKMLRERRVSITFRFKKK